MTNVIYNTGINCFQSHCVHENMVSKRICTLLSVTGVALALEGYTLKGFNSAGNQPLALKRAETPDASLIARSNDDKKHVMKTMTMVDSSEPSYTGTSYVTVGGTDGIDQAAETGPGNAGTIFITQLDERNSASTATESGNATTTTVIASSVGNTRVTTEVISRSGTSFTTTLTIPISATATGHSTEGSSTETKTVTEGDQTYTTTIVHACATCTGEDSLTGTTGNSSSKEVQTITEGDNVYSCSGAGCGGSSIKASSSKEIKTVTEGNRVYTTTFYESCSEPGCRGMMRTAETGSSEQVRTITEGDRTYITTEYLGCTSCEGKTASTAAAAKTNSNYGEVYTTANASGMETGGVVNVISRNGSTYTTILGGFSDALGESSKTTAVRFNGTGSYTTTLVKPLSTGIRGTNTTNGEVAAGGATMSAGDATMSAGDATMSSNYTMPTISGVATGSITIGINGSNQYTTLYGSDGEPYTTINREGGSQLTTVTAVFTNSKGRFTTTTVCPLSAIPSSIAQNAIEPTSFVTLTAAGPEGPETLTVSCHGGTCLNDGMPVVTGVIPSQNSPISGASKGGSSKSGGSNDSSTVDSNSGTSSDEFPATDSTSTSNSPTAEEDSSNPSTDSTESAGSTGSTGGGSGSAGESGEVGDASNLSGSPELGSSGVASNQSNPGSSTNGEIDQGDARSNNLNGDGTTLNIGGASDDTSANGVTNSETSGTTSDGRGTTSDNEGTTSNVGSTSDSGNGGDSSNNDQPEQVGNEGSISSTSSDVSCSAGAGGSCEDSPLQSNESPATRPFFAVMIVALSLAVLI